MSAEHAPQRTLFGSSRLQMTDSIRLTVESLAAYGAAHKHWAIAWSGGKDSTALVTLVAWLIDSGKVQPPESLTVLYADTRLELLPLWLSAQAVGEEIAERGIDLRTVVAPMDKRFLVYVLGRGVPPPNNNTLRWCTRQIKVDPMRAEMDRLLGERDDLLMLTGVRLGESAVRDQRIALSCSKGDGECGQGWYQRDMVDRGRATLAPLLHWRVCHVWEWLKHWAPLAEFGDWSTELLAEVYGGDETEELHARTGCMGCPLATQDTALDSLLVKPQWHYLSPIKRLRPLWRELREPRHRLRKRGVELRQDGTPAANPQRMGPLLLESRTWALEQVLQIQADVNRAAVSAARPRINLLDDEEESRIRALISAETWPDGWDGDEALATDLIDLVGRNGSTQPVLRGLL